MTLHEMAWITRGLVLAALLQVPAAAAASCTLPQQGDKRGLPCLLVRASQVTDKGWGVPGACSKYLKNKCYANVWSYGTFSYGTPGQMDKSKPGSEGVTAQTNKISADDGMLTYNQCLVYGVRDGMNRPWRPDKGVFLWTEACVKAFGFVDTSCYSLVNIDIGLEKYVKDSFKSCPAAVKPPGKLTSKPSCWKADHDGNTGKGGHTTGSTEWLCPNSHPFLVNGVCLAGTDDGLCPSGSELNVDITGGPTAQNLVAQSSCGGDVPGWTKAVVDGHADLAGEALCIKTCEVGREYRVGTQCRACSNTQCSPGSRRTGTCSGTTDGFRCETTTTTTTTTPTTSTTPTTFTTPTPAATTSTATASTPAPAPRPSPTPGSTRGQSTAPRQPSTPALRASSLPLPAATTATTTSRPRPTPAVANRVPNAPCPANMFREGSSPGECFMCSNTICRVSGQKRTGRCGGTEDGWVCSEPAGLELPRQGQPPTSPKPTAPALGPANVNSSGAVGIDSEGGDDGGGGGGDAAMAAVWCTVAVLVVAGLALALFAWWRKRQTGRGGPAPAPRGQPAYNNNGIFPPPHSPRRSNTDASVPNPVFHAYVEPVQGQPDAYYAAKASASAVDYSKVDDDAGTAGSRGKLRCGDGPAYVDEARAPTGGSTYAECTDAGAGDGAERRCTWAGGRGRCTNVLLPGAPVGLCNKHTCANVNNGCARGKASMDLVCTACSAAPAAPGQRQGRGGIVRGERKGSILHGFDGEGTSA